MGRLQAPEVGKASYHCEQAPHGAPVTSGVMTATECHLLLFSLPWEHTRPAAATAKCSGHAQNLPENHCHVKGPATRSRLHHLPMGPCYCQRPGNQAGATSPAHCFDLPGSIHRPAPLCQGDNNLHTQRKETAGIQTKSSRDINNNNNNDDDDDPSQSTQGRLHI